MGNKLKAKAVGGVFASHNLSMNDVPMWLYEKFISDVSEKYDGVYWIKLMHIVQKAEAYDMMVLGASENAKVEEPQKENDESEGVLTLRGREV